MKILLMTQHAQDVVLTSMPRNNVALLCACSGLSSILSKFDITDMAEFHLYWPGLACVGRVWLVLAEFRLYWTS